MKSVPQISLSQLDEPPLVLDETGSWPESRHVFDEESIWAVNAALASNRPLLIRGEPGTGKSQLARAAAHVLNWPFLSCVVNARFEPEDLLYRYDAVARLAQAQVMPREQAASSLTRDLEPSRFLLPEILWWAFDSHSAQKQFKKSCDHCGETVSNYAGTLESEVSPACVVLIDEIDKADSEVPNSLLEALGNGGFQAPFGTGQIRQSTEVPPLVVITTNEERELPPAFMRRCLVLQMDLPREEDALRETLVHRARAHYPEERIDDKVCEEAIKQLIADRKYADGRDLPLPGQAELLDVFSALEKIASTPEEQVKVLRKIRAFAFSKNREAER